MLLRQKRKHSCPASNMTPPYPRKPPHNLGPYRLLVGRTGSLFSSLPLSTCPDSTGPSHIAGRLRGLTWFAETASASPRSKATVAGFQRVHGRGLAAEPIRLKLSGCILLPRYDCYPPYLPTQR